MQPVFLPLYNLHLIYGKIFRLSFGPKSFVVISDNQIAKEASAAPAATFLRRPQTSRSLSLALAPSRPRAADGRC